MMLTPPKPPSGSGTVKLPENVPSLLMDSYPGGTILGISFSSIRGGHVPITSLENIRDPTGNVVLDAPLNNSWSMPT